MGRESKVEIPQGSGNFYRYEYDEESGKTLYRGPVGSAPELSEGEFFGKFSSAHQTDTIGPYNISHLRNKAQMALFQVIENFDDHEYDEGRADYLVDNVAPGAAGTHMPEYVVDEFHDLLYEKAQEYWNEENEWYEPEIWDELIEPKMSKIADQLNERIELSVPYGYSTNFFFGSSEELGDYGLFLLVEKEE